MKTITLYKVFKKYWHLNISNAHCLFLIFFFAMSTKTYAQPNNNCAGAINLTVGAPCTNGTTAGATLEAWESAGPSGTGCWGTAPSSTVWYTFTTGAAGNYTVSTDNGGSNDTQLKILAGTCGAFGSAPGCSDDDGTAYAFAAVASATLPAATTYYVQVDYYGAATGPFCINVTYNPPVSNDCIFSAIDITTQINGISGTNPFDCAPYTYAIGGSAPTQDNVNGNNTPCDPGPDYRDIWFSFTVTASTPDVWIDVYQATGTAPDYTAAVYSGTPAGTCGAGGNITGLTTVDCSDGVSAGGTLDVGACTTPLHPRINVSTLPPGTYYYRVWEWGGGVPSNGIINLCVESATPIGITSDPCPSAPTMGLGCGAANTNVNETYPNLSNAGCLGNACNTALNEPQLAIGGAGQIHNNCAGAWLTSVGYLNNVMNNSAIYAFNVNGSGTCQASVTITFNNIEYAGTNGNVMQVQVMNAPCAGGSSAVMAGTTADPCFEMRPTSGTLPNGTYYIVVDGQDGQLMEFDLSLNITYGGVGCTPSTPPPAPTAVNGSRCGPGTVNLSVTGCSGTANWYAAPTGGTAFFTGSAYTTPSLSSTTTYYVSCTVGGCESARTAVTATINPLPSVTVNSVTICSGASTTLTATPSTTGGTYAWSPGTGTTQTISVSPVSTTTYSVTYTLSGCSNTGTGTVTVNPVPTVTVNSTTICNGSSATLTATPSISGGTYSWSPGSATTSSITISPASTTTYSVTYTLSGCSNTGAGTVTVNPVPTVTVNSTTICNGASATLTGTPSISGGTYSWSPGSATTSSITISPSSTTTYSVTYTLNGCSNTGTGTVTVNPIPTITVNSPSICNGSTATLTAGGGATYLWSNGSSSNPVSVSPLTTTSYTVTGTTSGCSGTAVATVTVNPNPTATVSGGGTICAGATTTVNITLTGSAPWAFTYSDGSTTNTITGVNSSPYVITTGSNGTYSVSVISDANCSGTTSGSATVTVMPAIVISSVVSNCNGAMTDYTVSFEISGGDPATYIVTGGTGTISSTPPYVFTSDPIPASSPNYSFTVNDVNNCSPQTISGTQNCNCAATASMSGGGTVCAGTTTTINISLTGIGPWSIVYTDGTTSTPVTGINSSPYVITTGTAGTYSLVSMSDSNCNGSVSGSATIIVDPGPTVSVNSNTMCPGGATTLTATPSVAGGSYVWSPGGGSTQTISVSPASNTTYTVTYTLSGCSSTATGSVTLNTIPTATMSGGATVCPGATTGIDIVLTGTGPWSFTYSDGSTTNTITGINSSPYTINTGTAGTYSLISVNDANCNGSVSGGATVANVPPIIISNIISGCNSAGTDYTVSFEISGGDPASYIVTGGTGTITSSAPYIFTSDPVPASMPNYSFTVNDVYNCSPQTISGTQNCACTASSSMSGGGTICAGSTVDIFVDLVGIAPWSITYSDGSTSTTITGILSSPYIITTGTAGNYSVVSVSDANCIGSSSGTATVIVNPVPTVTVNSTAICDGSSATMTASPSSSGGTYSWSTGASTQSITDSPASTTTYSVTYTLSGCSITDSGTVTVNPVPVMTAVADIAACVNSTIPTSNFTSTPSGATFNWTNSNTLIGIPASGSGDITSFSATNATASPITGTVTVIPTLGGCAGPSEVYTITVNPDPTAFISGGGTLCNGASANVSISFTGAAPWDVIYSNGTINTAVSGIGTSGYSFATPDTGTYTVVAISDANCNGTASGSADVNNYPPIQVNISGLNSVCPGSPTTLTALASGGSGPYGYSWSPAGSGNSINVSPTTTTTYIVNATDGCATPGSDTIVVNMLPVPNVAFNSDLLSGCAPMCINLTDASSASGGISNWSWSIGTGGSSTQQNPSLYCFDSPGQYSIGLTVTGNNGCDATLVNTNMITVYAIPNAGIIAENNVSITDPTVSFISNSSNATSWSWNFGDPSGVNNTSSQENPTHTYSDPGIYCVTLLCQNGAGCTDTTTFCVTVEDDFTFFIPNAFSPDGDGLNDEFFGKGNGIEEFEMSIYDRWGNLIFHTNDLEEHWKGNMNNVGEPCQMDVYVYNISLRGGGKWLKYHNYIGKVTLVR